MVDLMSTTTAPTMTGWRLYRTTAAGTLHSPQTDPGEQPIARAQNATCHRGCKRVPGPRCACGWYFSPEVGELRSMAEAFQHYIDLGVSSGLTLVGVSVTNAIHFPPSAHLEDFPAAQRSVIDGKLVDFVEGDGTYRGRRLTITGPIVTNLTDTEALRHLEATYRATVHSSPLAIVTVIDRLIVAGETHGHAPEALMPHLAALLDVRDRPCRSK